MNIIEAINSDRIFKLLFRDLSTWERWEVFLKALFGLRITDRNERKIFCKHTGRRKLPSHPFSEAYCVVGRRGGKSFISSIIACYFAVFNEWQPHLSPGERCWIFIIATDRAQSKIIKDYISGILHSKPIFERMILNETLDEIHLNNGVSIGIKTCSFRGIRGYTVGLAICEEISFWRDEFSANPAQEILASLRPCLGSIPNSMLLGISTPYAKSGSFWESYRAHYGKPSDVLIWQGTTQEMNPSFDKSIIKKALKDDPLRALQEWFSKFRDDVSNFLGLDDLETVISKGSDQLGPFNNAQYYAFCDPSGGKQDAFSLAISSKPGDKIILNYLTESIPPFSPSEVVLQFSEILKSYNLSSVTGDVYGGEWIVEAFRNCGITFYPSELNKSQLYLGILPLIMNKSVEFLNNRKMVAQFCGLVRKTRSGGKDSIDHFPGGKDDLANSVAGACLLAAKAGEHFRLEASRGILEDIKTPEEIMLDDTMNWLLETPGVKKRNKKSKPGEVDMKALELEQAQFEREAEEELRGGKSSKNVVISRGWGNDE